MSLGGFWDALRGANGLGGQIWAVSLIVAIASGVPLLIYLSKRLRGRMSKAPPVKRGNMKIEGNMEATAPFSLGQAVQRLEDLIPVLRQEAQKLDGLEKENMKLKALNKARSKRRERERGREVKHGFWRKEKEEVKVTEDRPIRRKGER